MKTLALAVCLLGSVVALSACETTAHSTETTTSGSTVMERSVTK